MKSLGTFTGPPLGNAPLYLLSYILGNAPLYLLSYMICWHTLMEEPKNGMEKVQPLFCPSWKQASDEEKSIANSQLRLVQISTPTRLTIWVIRKAVSSVCSTLYSIVQAFTYYDERNYRRRSGPTPLASASSIRLALSIVYNSSYSPKVVCLQDDL